MPAVPSRLRRLDRAPEPLEEGRQTAALKRKLLEDLSWMPVPWVGPYNDHDGFSGSYITGFRGVADGSTGDRQHGRNLPLFWNELDLRGFRVLSRHLCESNDFAIGFSTLLTNYHVRKGVAWAACRKGAKKSPYPTTGAPSDPLVEKGQRILDTWRDAVKWPVLSREAFKRWRRDGEPFGRFFAQGWQKLPLFRFIDPSQIGHPQGQTVGDESFGIATPAGDPAGIPIAYHVWDHDRVGYGEWVDADRIVHAKANVDSDVKRGLPDFFPAAEALDGAQKLVHTMLATAIRQARVAWREKFPTASAAQAQGLTPVPAGPTSSGSTTSTPESLPWWLDPTQIRGRVGVNGFRRSDVVRVEGNREFEAGPTMAGASSYIEVEQAALRACGVRWSMPEYFSGDASNNNMASSFVANSPFVTAVECSQEEWAAAWERPIALKVLEYARDAGLLTHEEWSQLDVETTAAQVATPEPDKDAIRITELIQSRVMCLDTARQQLGLDPQHEAEGVKKDTQTQQQQQQPGGGGAIQTVHNPDGTTYTRHTSAGFGNNQQGQAPGGTDDTGGGLFGEGRLSEEGQPPFPGAVFDRTKHRWVKGTPDPTPAPKETQTDPSASSRTDRRQRDAAAGEHYLATAQERPRSKHLQAAQKYTDTARRRRVIHAVKNEGEFALAIGGHNLPDSEPADVVHMLDAAGKPITSYDAVKAALRQREEAVRALKSGKLASGAALTDEQKTAYKNRLNLPAHFFEVKTLITSAKSAVHMNAKALARKERWIDRYGVSFSVVAIDDRKGQKHSGNRVYVAPHELGGTTRLDKMKPVAMADVLKAVQ